MSMNGRAPDTRFVCLECPVDAEYEAEHWSVQLCTRCFDGGGVSPFPHVGAGGKPHLRWLRVGSDGAHEVVVREAMAGVVLQEVQLCHLSVHGEGAAVDCPACYCYELSADNPVASLPGCQVPEHQCCVRGCFDRLETASRRHFVAGPGGALPPAAYFCAECRDAERRQQEVDAVLREMRVIVEGGATAAEAVEQLKAAHARHGDVNAHLHSVLDAALGGARGN